MDLGQFLADHWGDLASVVRLVISVVGLAITIWVSFKAKKAAETAKTAAEQARDAARQVKDRIATLDTLADASAAIAIMEEIKRLQRSGAWPIALDRCSTFKKASDSRGADQSRTNGPPASKRTPFHSPTSYRGSKAGAQHGG